MFSYRRLRHVRYRRHTRYHAAHPDCRTAVAVRSSDIERASLHISLPWYLHLYTIPFLSLYPVWAYAYYFRYDDWIKSEEWTFLGCVCLGAGHALSFLVTRWSNGARARITTRNVSVVVLRWLSFTPDLSYYRQARYKMQIVFGLYRLSIVDRERLFLLSRRMYV